MRRRYSPRVTLGVQDSVTKRDFSRHLDWPPALDSADFAVFEVRGAVLALFPVDKPAADARTDPETRRAGIRASVIMNVENNRPTSTL